jgi:hypothetical protein
LGATAPGAAALGAIALGTHAPRDVAAWLLAHDDVAVAACPMITTASATARIQQSAQKRRLISRQLAIWNGDIDRVLPARSWLAT